jgi:hypothetical protein
MMMMISICFIVAKQKEECKLPKKIKCGFGQVLKVKFTDDGCIIRLMMMVSDDGPMLLSLRDRTPNAPDRGAIELLIEHLLVGDL